MPISAYPGALDTIAEDKTNRTRNPSDHPNHHNLLASAVKQIQAALGVDPAGSYDTVVERLDAGLAGLSSTTLTGVLDSGSTAITGRKLIPGSPNDNGLIIQAPDATWELGSGNGVTGAGNYGTRNAILGLKHGTGSVQNLLVAWRVDAQGGAGFGGGIHSAAGLHFTGTPTPTQNIWVQNFADMVGIAISAYGSTPAGDLILATNGPGTQTLFEVTANGVVKVRSQTTSDYSYLGLGRGANGDEGILAVAASSGQFTASAAAGDVILKAQKSGGATLRLAAIDSDLGPTLQYARLLVKKDQVIVNFDDSSSSGKLYGSIGFFAQQHKDYGGNAQLSMSANGDTILNAASDTYPLRLRVASTDVGVVKTGGLFMSQPIDMGSHKIVALTDPTSAQEAATKAYADLKLAKASNLSDVASASSARTNLGLAIGSDVQAFLGYTAENAANKDTDTALAANSDVKYASQKAVKAYVDGGAGVAAGNELAKSGATLSAGTGSSGFAKGAFSANRHAALSVANTGAALACDTEDLDVSSWFDTATGKFTPQVAGYYRLSAMVTLNAIAIGKQVYGYVYKNGASYALLQITPPTNAAGNISMGGSIVVQANGSTDYFEVFIFHTDTVNRNVAIDRAGNNFSGEFIGRS